MKNFRDRYKVVNGIPTILPANVVASLSENLYIDSLNMPQTEPVIEIDFGKIDVQIDALEKVRARWALEDPNPNWYS